MNLQPIPRLENGLLRYDQTIGRKILGPRFRGHAECRSVWCEEAVKDSGWVSCVRCQIEIVHSVRENDRGRFNPVSCLAERLLAENLPLHTCGPQMPTVYSSA